MIPLFEHPTSVLGGTGPGHARCWRDWARERSINPSTSGMRMKQFALPADPSQILVPATTRFVQQFRPFCLLPCSRTTGKEGDEFNSSRGKWAGR